MSTAVTQKGQVTIPKRIRDLLGIGPGSRVRFAVGADGEVRILAAEDREAAKVRGQSSDPVAAWRGTLRDGLTTDEFMRLMRGDD